MVLHNGGTIPVLSFVLQFGGHQNERLLGDLEVIAELRVQYGHYEVGVALSEGGAH